MITNKTKKTARKTIISQTSNALNMVKKVIINRIASISRKKKRKRIKTIPHDQKMIAKLLTNSQFALLNEKTKLLLQRKKRIMI